MISTIIIAVDLGHFKAYRVTKDPLDTSPRVTLIESYDSIEGHGKLGEKFSGAAGKFRRSGEKEETANGVGERHNIELEMEKRLSKMIAKDIDALIESEKCAKWYFASGEKINRQIIENLKPEAKERLSKNIAANLTRVDKSEILSHFT